MLVRWHNMLPRSIGRSLGVGDSRSIRKHRPYTVSIYYLVTYPSSVAIQMRVRRDKLLDFNWVELQVLDADEDGHESLGSGVCQSTRCIASCKPSIPVMTTVETGVNSSQYNSSFYLKSPQSYSAFPPFLLHSNQLPLYSPTFL
jgi:hypothetical protein